MAKQEDEMKPFAAVLVELGRGSTERELSEALHDLVARVQDTRKKGVLSYTLQIEPMKGDSDALLLTDAIKLKLPEHDRSASIFFADRDGNLVREDPNQPSLFGPASNDRPRFVNVSDLSEVDPSEED